MKVLVVASPKGGVGKTTVSLNLSYALAKRGHRTLLVDCDPQGAIGLGLSKKISQAPGLAEIAVKGATLQELVIQTKMENLSLLMVGRISAKYTTQFNNLLNDGSAFHKLLTHASEYDIVIFDTPCGFGGATMGALRCADYVISPVQAEPVSLRAIPQLLEVLAWLKEDGSPIELAGLLISMWQEDHTTSMSVVKEIQERFPKQILFDTMLPRDPLYLKASEAGVPLGLMSRMLPPQAFVFEQLAFELENRIFQGQEPNDEPLSLVD